MPVFRIEGPDKKVYRVEAPDEQTALSGLQKEVGAPKSKAYQDISKVRGKNSFSDQVTGAMSLGLQNLTNAGVATLTSQAPRLMGKDPGYGIGEAFQAARNVERDRSDEYAKNNPIKNVAGGLLGGLAMPGGQQLAKLATPAVKGALGLLEGVGRGAAIGAGLGGAYSGATSRPGEELRDIKRGAVTGGVVGGAVPVATAAAGAVGRGVAGAGRTVARATNKASGGQLLNPTREAGKRLVEAMRADGMDEAMIRATKNEILRTGVTPTLLDVVSANGGGQNTRALLRGAAMTGPARNTASRYADQVVGDLQDNAIGLAERLTPGNPQSAPELRSGLESAVKASDAALYPAFQSDAVPVDAIGDALTGDTGRNALMAARKIADARRDFNAVQEIDALAAGKADQVSAGTLDLIRRGLRDAGQEAMQGANSTLGGGLTGRASDLRESLLNVPGFRQATEASSALRGQMDAIDVGAKGMTARPDQFSAELGQLAPEALDPARVGYRQAITDQIGAPAEGSTGALNKLATSTNQGRNLEIAFGAKPAQDFRAGMGNLIDQTNNARFINPNTGSQTAGRAVDQQLVDGIPTPRLSILGLLSSAWEKIQRGATLTDAERQALVEMGISTGTPDQLAPQLAQPVRQQFQQTGARLAPALALGVTTER